VEDYWVDKTLEKAGVYRITQDDYVNWIYNAEKGSTPWLLMMTWTPYGNPKTNF
jgi:hypothetical protein